MAKPCSWQKCRRTAASVSLKVGRRLRYQAALITAPRAFGLSCAASRVTRENSPSRQGVVRAMARSAIGVGSQRPDAPGSPGTWSPVANVERPAQDLVRVLVGIGAEQGL